MIAFAASFGYLVGFGKALAAQAVGAALAQTLWLPPSISQSESSESFVRSISPSVENVLCSVNAVDTELSRILQNLSIMTKANLVLLSGQTTKLTLRLSDVRLADLIRHICALTNLKHLRIGTTYVIATEQQLRDGYPAEWLAAHPVEAKAAEIVSISYLANYVTAAGIAESIKGAFPDSLKITVAPDQTAPTVSTQDTSYATGIQSGVVGREAEKNGRKLILQGPKELVEAALALIRELDYERQQVSILVTIHDVSNDALREAGVSWSIGDVNITETPSGFNVGTFNRTGLSFSAVIKALEKKDQAKLLASPSVSVLDGERAFILIGSRLSYPVLVGYSQANTPIYDKQTERVGIYLQVAASISSKNQVTLNLYPQVSTITGYLQINGASYPQVATREAQTTLRVASGETIILGGLLRDEEIRQMEKVPILGDIPLLGELFKRRKVTKTQSQVVISMTPTVLPASKDESR
jgi:type II secretory pathway component GspD/PulD (secretin)